MIKLAFAVAMGGALGSIFRFLGIQKIQSYFNTTFPLGVFLVNFLGCFLIGLLYVLIIDRLALSPVWRAAVLVGFLGGFTTFSSFTMDTLNMMQQGNYLPAFIYIVVSVILCFGANVLGIILGRML